MYKSLLKQYLGDHCLHLVSDSNRFKSNLTNKSITSLKLFYNTFPSGEQIRTKAASLVFFINTDTIIVGYEQHLFSPIELEVGSL